MKSVRDEIDMSKLPVHIAIIMDGNGRWAKKRLLPRKLGHKAGAETLEKITKAADKLGVKHLTVYAFSTENWKRSEEEVNGIMDLLRDYLDRYVQMANKENIKLDIIGEKSRLAEDIQEKIKNIEEISSVNTGLNLHIALNYGGRDEIVNAVKRIYEKNISSQGINEQLISDNLYTAGLPDVDLIIRPSGEQRISNFLIWQSAYAEFVFMDVLWPDFEKKDLEYAITEYSKRNRRFGGI